MTGAGFTGLRLSGEHDVTKAVKEFLVNLEGGFPLVRVNGKVFNHTMVVKNDLAKEI